MDSQPLVSRMCLRIHTHTFTHAGICVFRDSIVATGVRGAAEKRVTQKKFEVGQNEGGLVG